MNPEVDIYVARALMIDRLQYKLADVEYQTTLEKNADASIHNDRLASLNVLHGVLSRKIEELENENSELLIVMYHDLTQ